MNTAPLHALALLALAGCASAPPPAAAPVRQALATNAAGLTLEEARQRSLQLRTALTSAEVLTMLGSPDETEARTLGQKTPEGGWLGTVWNYRWPAKRLTIVFQHDGTARQYRINDIIGFEKWAEQNKAGGADYTAEQIAARAAELRAERLRLESDTARGLDYLLVNSWSWHDF